MNKQTVGTCSLCGGPVTVPTVYWSVVPPKPRCEQCGAVAKRAFGPVIDMERSAAPRWYPLRGYGAGSLRDRVSGG